MVDHFKKIWCVAYTHIPDQKRKKLNDNGDKYIFLFVSDQSKDYKVYNPSLQKIVIIQDVVFHEDQTQSWRENIVTQYIPVDFDDDEKMPQPVATQNVLVNSQSPLISATNDYQLEEKSNTPTVTRPQCNRKRSTWMEDYEVTGID